MAKIKQIARKLDNGFYERVSLGATNVSELINDSNYITAADLPVDAVVIPFAEQYHIAADEKVGEEYCRALMDCFDENDNLIRDIYILVPSDNDNLLSLNSYQNKGTDSSGNKTKVLDFSILYDNDAVFFIVVQVTLITDANKENVAIIMEIKSHTDLQRKLTFDKVPTKGSHYNPVTSDGIKTYVDNAVPTKLSVLTNDSGFITNTVTNLTNYYTKSETYTQDEVKALIDAITTLNIEVVTELPTENISATTIYLKGVETTGANDYEEWIYANNDWELIGTTAVDLSNYYNKTEADEQFAKLSLYGDTTINVGRKNNTSIGERSTAEGYATTASGEYSHAEGYFTKATEQTAHAEGYQTEATGSCAHAEGNVSKATGMRSHAEGEHTTASGDYSHAEGSYTKASGKYSHAGGYHTVASKEGSYAEGFETQAIGPRAHAEGDHTIASGSASHAEGYNTIASGENQHVQGRYNLEDSADTYAHIVGNGWSGANSNAHTLDWNGNAWFSGDVYIKSTSGTNKDEGSKRLITEDEVPTTTSALTNDSGFITETELDNKGYIVGISDNRKIIAAGPGGVKYSLDGGKIWNDATGVNGGYGICYGNNKFVIAGPLGINYSEDGINWNSAENINWMMYDVAYGNNIFVAIGQTYGEVIYSSDGINWTSTGVVLDYYDTYYSIIYANEKFVITSGSQNNNRSYYSTDGITWLIMGGLPESTYYDIAYGQNKYIVVGEDYPYSCIDGLNWNLSIDNTSGYSRSQMAITYGNDRFISVGNGGKSYYSLNGSTWVEMSGLDTSDTYNNILYSEGEFICIGTNSVYRSKDGETWTKETAEIAIDVEDLVYTGTITTAEYYTKTEINNMLGSVGGDISLSDPLAYEAIV